MVEKVLVRFANAPCSWGVLEYGGSTPLSAAAYLNEVRGAGYEGTELGPYGFLPADPGKLKEALGSQGLLLAGAFVDLPLAEAHWKESLPALFEVARLLCEVGRREAPPRLLLSDKNGVVEARVKRAGRVRPQDGLPPERFCAFARRAEEIAREVQETTGVTVAFHPHCAGYVEAPWEVEALFQEAPELKLCLDTGHCLYAGGNPLEALRKWKERLVHVHLKDCDAKVLQRAREEEWDYFRAVREGVFTPLSKGMLKLPEFLEELRAIGYEGWLVIEQDLCEKGGSPQREAEESLRFLKEILRGDRERGAVSRFQSGSEPHS